MCKYISVILERNASLQTVLFIKGTVKNDEITVFHIKKVTFIKLFLCLLEEVAFITHHSVQQLNIDHDTLYVLLRFYRQVSSLLYFQRERLRKEFFIKVRRVVLSGNSVMTVGTTRNSRTIVVANRWMSHHLRA